MGTVRCLATRLYSNYLSQIGCLATSLGSLTSFKPPKKTRLKKTRTELQGSYHTETSGINRNQLQLVDTNVERMDGTAPLPHGHQFLPISEDLRVVQDFQIEHLRNHHGFAAQKKRRKLNLLMFLWLVKCGW